MSKTINLKHPFTFQGEEVEEITIRRPKIRDLKTAQKHKDDMEKSIHMVANLAEVSPQLVEEMDAEDFGKVSEVLADFMGALVAPTP